MLNNRARLLRLAFIFAVLAVSLQVIAVSFYLLSYYWWFDNTLHFAGGLCVGFFSLWLYTGSREGGFSDTDKILLSAVLGALIVGIGWEIFEYSAGITSNTIGSYPLDTVKDLAVDVLGGYGAYCYFIIGKFYRKP